MAMKLKIKKNCPWANRPMWQLRVHGFFTYLFCAFTSVIWPVQTDKAMFDTLSQQFEEEK